MSGLPRILAIMGSGELAPTMVATHRRLTSLLPKPVRAALIDTPFGFQENAPELSARAVEHFATSINVDLRVAGLERLHDTHLAADPVQVERGLRLLDESDYLFAGPGSPTYALRQWSGSRVADIICDKIDAGGIVVFASAAALTLGRHTVPVYEIYKVGEDVSRLDGLDILSRLGIDAVVIPHYNNAEGGHHDTRFCYLGETRLQMFETMLPDDTYVLGVDEHTGLVIDLDGEEATVVGNSVVTIRLRDHSTVFASGETIPLDVLRDPTRTSRAGVARETTTALHEPRPPSTVVPMTSLADEADRLRGDFDDALARRDATGATRAVLELEHVIREWSADTLQGSDGDHARATFRAMISALGDAATGGLRDTRDVIGPVMSVLLEVRRAARAEKLYTLSDLIRDEATQRGIEIRDTPDGAEWHLIDD